MNARHCVAGLCVALVPAFGHAAEPTDLDSPSEAVENPAAAARAANAGGDHGFLTSHAETLPAGTFSLNIYELLIYGFSAGLTDRLQLSLSITPPFGRPPEGVSLQARYVVHRSERTVVAVRLTNLDFSSWDYKGYGGGFYTLGPGVAVDRFVGDSGRFSVHTGLSLHTGPIVGNSAAVEDAAEESTTAEWAGLLWFEAGVTFRATDWLDLMVEGMGAATMTNDSGFRALPYALVNYGVRFFGDFVAADVALMRPLGDLELGWLVMGLPYLGLSARF